MNILEDEDCPDQQNDIKRYNLSTVSIDERRLWAQFLLETIIQVVALYHNY